MNAPLSLTKPVREAAASFSPDTAPTKRCCTCRETKPLDAFHRASAEPDGRQPRCKACTRIADKARFEAQPGYFVTKADRWARLNQPRRRELWRECAVRARARYPEKARATHAVRNAIRRGKLQRGSCEVCGAPSAQAHHEDYSKPLEVRWLCSRHHSAVHQRTRRVSP